MRHYLNYIAAYPEPLQEQVKQMIADDSLGAYLLEHYPTAHRIANDSELRDYVLDLKQQFMKQSPPLSKVVYDHSIHVIDQALGLHTYAARVQGSRLKRKNEIRISTVFRRAPERFLRMIAVHELAHLKEKEHNKTFYHLCQHMLPDYFQLEFDARLYLIQLELGGELYGNAG